MAYEFAERRLEAHRAAVLGLGKGEKRGDGGKLKRVYMVGGMSPFSFPRRGLFFGEGGIARLLGAGWGGCAVVGG